MTDTTELLPHQRRVVERLRSEDQPGLVVAHGLGSGKTLTSIAAANALGAPATVVTPAALGPNYKKEIAKHTKGRGVKFQHVSLQGAARKGQLAADDTLIVDEAHRIRDTGSKGGKAVLSAKAKKRILLTASPVYNHPADLAALINTAANSRVLPADRDEFERAFVEQKRINPSLWARIAHGAKPGERASLRRDSKLLSATEKWVDYHENPKGSEDFPSRVDSTYHVPISGKQKEVYDTVINRAPAWLKYKIRSGLPPSKAESKQLNAFMTGARQAQLSPGVFGGSSNLADATKQQVAFKRFQAALSANPEHRAVVYSNYVDAGLDPYHRLLEQNKVPHAVFTGKMKPAERIQAVKDYNEGRLKALLLSSAGGEGLDLKGTRQIQILEPHFNEEKLKQVIGRGIRYQSHSHLPAEQRDVAVERYLSKMPVGFWGKLVGKKPDMSADEYLQSLSNDKETLNEQMRAVLREQTARRIHPTDKVAARAFFSELQELLP